MFASINITMSMLAASVGGKPIFRPTSVSEATRPKMALRLCTVTLAVRRERSRGRPNPPNSRCRGFRPRRYAARLHQHQRAGVQMGFDGGIDLLARERLERLGVSIEPSGIEAALSVDQDGFSQP